MRSARLTRFVRAVLLPGLVALTAPALGGCAGAATASARPADTIVALEPSDANTIDPLFANNQPATTYGSLVLDGLVENGPNLTFVPALATHWATSPDRLHWTVELRRGVRWSDGVPFDSRDVVFTWSRILDPKVGDPYLGQFDFLKKVVAEGPYRVRFDLSRPYAGFVAVVLLELLIPEHILAKIPPAQMRFSPTGFGEHPVGLGPYRVDHWDHDNEAVFVRNDKYWRGPAKTRRLDIKIVLNQDAIGEAMRNREGDFTETVDASIYRNLALARANLVFLQVPDLYERFVMINLRQRGLRDHAVREAMQRGWNREALAAGLFHGGERIDDTITPLAILTYHDKDTVHYPYDPARARALLDAAGWRPGPAGIRTKNGFPLAFTLSLPNKGPGGANPMLEFQSDMAAIGIRIAVQVLDYPTFINRTSAFEYQLAYTGWGGVVDPDQYTFLYSTQAAPAGNNDTGYANPAVDRDLIAGQTAATTAQRKVAYDDMQRRTTADLPVIWGYDDYERFLLSRRLDVHGDREPDGNFWWNVYDWTLRS